MIGGKNEWVVLNETLVGVHPEDGFEPVAPKGIRKRAPQVRTGPRRRANKNHQVVKILPGRTIHKKTVTNKKPAAVMKKPCAVMKMCLKRPSSVLRRPASALKRPAGIQGTSADPRSNGRWLWAAVTVGRGSDVYTHDNGLKRFTFKFLPKSSEAILGKPRGLGEIKKVLTERIRPRSKLIFDKWLSTVGAATRLGFKFVPPINHSVEWRDKETGFHTNDIESENNRMKHWSRVRNGRLSLTELDMHEYAYYINVGSDMKSVMKVLNYK
jgi:hypothetical protein